MEPEIQRATAWTRGSGHLSGPGGELDAQPEVTDASPQIAGLPLSFTGSGDNEPVNERGPANRSRVERPKQSGPRNTRARRLSQTLSAGRGAVCRWLALAVVLAGSGPLGCRPAPDSARFLRERGQFLRQERRWTEAEEVLSRAVTRFPGDPEIQAEWGLLCRDLERTDAALVALQQAVQARPDQSEWQLRLGQTWNDAGEWQAAVTPLNRAVLDRELASEGWQEIVRAHVGAGDWNAALKAAGRWREVEPASPEAGLLMAQCQLALNEFEAATRTLNLTIGLDPQHAESWRARSELWRRLGQEERAAADARRATEVARSRALDQPPPTGERRGLPGAGTAQSHPPASELREDATAPVRDGRGSADP